MTVFTNVMVLSLVFAISTAESGENRLPLQPERKVSFQTDEATWMSVDVSLVNNSIVFDILGDLYLIDSKGGKAQPVMTGAAYDYQPVFSPDGKKIAFISDRSGSQNVWIANVDGSDAVQLSNGSGEVNFSSPAWSADGEYVFASRQTGTYSGYQLWMYHRLGGVGIAPLDHAESGNVLDVFASADGQYLYYSHRSGGQFSIFSGGALPAWTIKRYNLKTGQSERLVNAPGGGLRPVVSPDGRYLTYATRVDTKTELRLRDLQSGEDRCLLYPVDRDQQDAIGRGGMMPGYTFTPDGKSLVISYGGKIHRVAVATGRDEVIPFSAQVNLDIGPSLQLSQKEKTGPVRARIAASPTLSPNGKLLAFSAFGKLYVMPSTGGEARRLTNTPLVEGGVTENQPAWSPDGRWIAYVTWSGEGGHVFKVQTSGKGKPQRLTRSPGYFRKPVYVPDGNTVVALYSSTYDRNQSELDYGDKPFGLSLVQIPDQGGDMQVLSNLPRSEVRAILMMMDTGSPHFSGDGQNIYVYLPGGMFTVPAKGGVARRVVEVNSLDGLRQTRNSVEDMRISPDGKWLLTLNDGQLYILALPETGDSALTFDLNSPGVANRRITDIGADFFGWADGGRKIYWSVGSTFYSLPFSEKLFIAEDAGSDTFAEDALQGVEMIALQPRDLPSDITVLRGATTVTMKGEQIIPKADIVIAKNRISAIGATGQVAIPEGATIRDVSGKFISPGFIDTHAHWMSIRRGVIDYDSWSHKANLAYGVTAGLDVQAFSHDTFIYQDLIDIGVISGPRAYSTGRGIMSTNRFSSKEHALGVLKRYKDHYRTNNIKAYRSGNRLQRQYVVQAAKALGMMPTTEGGVDTELDITHAIDGFAANEHSFPVMPLYKDIVQLYVKSGIGYSPTLIVNYGGPQAIDYFFTRYNPLDDVKLNRFIPRQFIEARARRRHMWFHDKEFIFDQVGESAARIFRAGGKVSVGAHGELQGLGYHWELEAFAASGLTPHEVLQIATRGSAEVIGRSPDIGTLEPGKFADLIVFDENPLVDIRNTQSIRYVMKNGRLYRGDDLELLNAD